MFPFWEVAIAPVFDAVGAKRVVEIGALRGEHTVLMLERLGEDAELHVIDPKPEFDPSEHERQFPGRYFFHRDLSLDALPVIPPVDVALVDGDHNWYTVFNELTLIAQTSRTAGEPLPVIILHDVCWPYGRRDLYYDPDTIPEEFRQQHAQLGMVPEKTTLVWLGGINPTMQNAVHEGGERNGVMTAIDDFVTGYDRPIRRVLLPIYFGLEILVDDERLARNPELAAVLDDLEGPGARQELLELSEHWRIKALLLQHNLYFQRERQHERHAARFLNLLKGALLDEHYLENEVRIDHLRRCIQRGVKPDLEQLRDPQRQLPDRLRRIAASRASGLPPDKPDELTDELAYTTMGRVRLDHLQSCLDIVRAEGVAGDLVECGAGRGGGAIFLRGYLATQEMTDRQVWVADRFAPAGDVSDEGIRVLEPDLNTVRDAFDRFDLLDEQVRFLQGSPRETLSDAPIERVALLHVGGDVDPTVALDALYDRISLGGYVVIDDHRTWADEVQAFRDRRGVQESLERVDWASAGWRKLDHAPLAAPAETVERPARAPLAAPAPASPKDLTVVVVFYNMRREAERTLHSLSRAYQRDVDDLDYEVMVVENGSDPDQKLDAEWVAAFGPEFRFLDLGGDADPSPVRALNRGIAAGAGKAFALMIDGAHVLTPRVLHFGMTGLDTYAPAVVATQQWYMGPGQQGEAMVDGYDQDYEDRLFTSVGWPNDGYRLFDIGHFIGDRDWLDGMWESNCLFAPRKLLEQVGSFDESFEVPGGGYANLDLYERLGSSPDTTFVTILGEGSFHHVHGGTTTNQASIDERNRRITSYAEHYQELRGRGFQGHKKPIHYVGTIVSEARRTRARRRVAPNFFKWGAPGDPDGFPEQPTPMPEDLEVEYTDAFWRSLRWRGATWLGQPVPKAPGDLFAYQEMLSTVRPEWIIDVGTGPGGRALFLASICELLGHGRVVSIDAKPHEIRPEHARITYVDGEPSDRDIIEQVRQLVGSPAHALLIVGTRGGRPQVVKEFEAYQDLVPPGSYVVIEDTIVNGHPVWASFGPGPGEAAKKILRDHRDFAADTKLERYPPSFNAGGYLKRVR